MRRVKSNDESWTIANKVAVNKEISFIRKKKDQINYEAEQALRLSLDELPSRRPLSHRGLKHKVLRRGSALKLAAKLRPPGSYSQKNIIESLPLQTEPKHIPQPPPESALRRVSFLQSSQNGVRRCAESPSIT